MEMANVHQLTKVKPSVVVLRWNADRNTGTCHVVDEADFYNQVT
jgi:hypothetical protein